MLPAEDTRLDDTAVDAVKDDHMAENPIRSRAALFGHPVHPMLVHFPVAALLGVVLVDAAFLILGDPFWARAGVWLAGVGTVGGWCATVPGMIDLFMVPRIRRLVTAWCHALLAVMMLSLASLNWVMRIPDHGIGMQPWAFYLSLLTAVVISGASWLGGQLVYHHGVAVDTGK